MSDAVASLRIDLFANIAEFRDGMNQAAGDLKKFEGVANATAKNLEKAGQKLSLALTAPLALFAGFAIKNAQDAEKLSSRVNVAFVAMADSVNTWADKTAKDFKRTDDDVKGAVVTFGQFFDQFTKSEEQTAALSESFAKLSLDLASFLKISGEDATKILVSALGGASKGVKRLGVDMSDGAVEAKAHALGIASGTVKLTEQQKVLARSAIIMEGLAKVQGDVARSADTGIGKQAAVAAQFDTIAQTIGQDLLPAFNQFLGLVAQIGDEFSKLDKPVRQFIEVAAGIAAAIGPILIVLGIMSRGFAIAAAGAKVFAGSLGVVAAGAAGVVEGVTAATVATDGLTVAQATATKSAGSLTSKFLLMSTLLLSLAPLADSFGKSMGDAFFKANKGSDEFLKTLYALPKLLGGFGGQSKDAAEAVARVRIEQGKLTSDSPDVQAAINKITAAASDQKVALDAAKTGMEGLHGQFKATADAADGLNTSVAGIVKGFGNLDNAADFLKEHKSDIERVRKEIDPTAEALRKFAEDMTYAKAAGLDLATSQFVLGNALVTQLGGIDNVSTAMREKLGPAFKDVFDFLDNQKENLNISELFKIDTGQIDKDFTDPLKAAFDNALKDIDTKFTEIFDLNKKFGDNDQLATYLDHIKKLAEDGAISWEVYDKAKKKALEDADPEATKAAAKALQEQQHAIAGIADELTDAVLGTESWADAFKNLITEMLKTQVIRPFITQGLSSLFGVKQSDGGNNAGGLDLGKAVAGLGSFFGGLFGARAGGGNVQPGMSYIVGERGRELFTPSQSGRISSAPDTSMKGGGITMNIYTPDVGSFRASARQTSRATRLALAR